MEPMRRHDHGRLEFYPTCAREWESYDFLLALPEVQASLRELWSDWLSKQSPDYIFNPSLDECVCVLYLVEREPLRWCYNRLSPDKETWGETAHLVRLLVQWQVVYRTMEQTRRGPLSRRRRILFVRDTLAIVAIWAKLQLSGSATIRHLTGR